MDSNPIGLPSSTAMIALVQYGNKGSLGCTPVKLIVCRVRSSVYREWKLAIESCVTGPQSHMYETTVD